jgi:hypothetical protein
MNSRTEYFLCTPTVYPSQNMVMALHTVEVAGVPALEIGKRKASP